MKAFLATALCFQLFLASVGADEEHRFAPDHLEPIDPFDDTGYDLAVYKSLLASGKERVWMISRPSFDVETAVAIEANPIFGTVPDPFGGGGFNVTGYDFFVTATRAKKKIWRWKEVSEKESVLDIRVTDDIERREAAIPESAVKVITAAWNAVLKDTRYVSENYRGLDGITFQFGGGTKTGEIWCPDGGAPLKLVELGNLLTRFANDEKVKREELLQDIELLANAITSSAKRPEQDGDGQARSRSEPVDSTDSKP